MEQTNQINLVYDVLAYQLARFPQKRALNSCRNNHWEGISTSDLIKKVNDFSCWLIGQDLKKGDMLAIMPEMGTPEWMIIDFACQQLGVIVVPIQPSFTKDELELIIKETNPVMLIVANNELVEEVQNKLDEIPTLYCIAQDTEHYLSGLEHTSNSDEINELMVRKIAINPEDPFTIMYTSGTSGKPKGVVLTHRNMVSNILFTLASFPLEPSWKVMSYLPFSHIFERSSCYAYLAYGTNIYFVQNRDTFLKDFKTVKPYFTTSVPRVLEKMYDYLQQRAHDQNLIIRTVSIWSLELAKKYYDEKKPGLLLRVKIFIARMLVFRRWTKQLGGRLRCIVVGAASLRPEIARMFSAAKIRIREGYGMTETSPLISLNRFDPGLNRFGTVGIPIPAIDLKINQPDQNGEGEIWVKGPNVFESYYKRPKLNQKVFENGWFKTGDVGKFVDGRFLKITDRKKDIFKTTTGKYVAPQPIENLFKSSLFIEQILIIGYGRPYLVALIVPNFPTLEDWCNSNEIHWTAPEYMIHNIKVQDRLEQEVDRLNNELPRYQQIRRFKLCLKEWTVENNLITGTHKLHRDNIKLEFEKEINKLYE